ncbi:MAG TPA: class I SAM-dependent methyltransferase [Longimicrobium sp.]|jgi:SAM-dependent methyltransferase
MNDTAPNGTPAGFRYASAELDSMAEAKNYYRWIASRFAPHLGSHAIEVGAGIGTFSQHLLRAAPHARLTLVEPAENNIGVLRERMAGDARVSVRHGYLDANAPESGASSVVAVNVLEHVEDDDAFLRAARRVLAPGGRLLLFVPALPAIYGTLDAAFEHFRRYTRPALRGKVADSGFIVDELHYVNLPGVLAWWASGVLLRKRTVTPRDARLYDRWAIPLIRAVESRWHPPLGQSLLLVATRREEP